jgi:hypothetical protein
MLHLYYTPVSSLLDFVDDFWLYDGYTQPHCDRHRGGSFDYGRTLQGGRRD